MIVAKSKLEYQTSSPPHTSTICLYYKFGGCVDGVMNCGTEQEIEKPSSNINLVSLHS